MKSIFWTLLINVVFLCSSYGQTRSVEGVVKDKSTGESLIGVNVMIEGTTTGTVTNFDGYYILDVPSDDAVLVFSFIGMNVVKEIVSSRETIHVHLAPDSEQLEDIMVVAYGTTTKEAYTGSAGVVTAEVLEDRPVNSFEKSLQGTTAGLQVSSSSGQPGSSAQVRIRGIGSLSASQSPLYVVDGVPMSGSLSDINPNDIESLTVLKDAAAASLYGSRAANGVIIVTTKQGESGETRISLNTQFGVANRISEGYELMNSTEIYEQTWMGLYNQAIYNNKTGAEAREYAHSNVESIVGFNPFGVANPLDDNGKVIPGTQVHTDTDWRDEVYKTGIIQNYDLSIAGGSDKTKVYFALGYFDDSGITLNSNFTRYSSKLNVNHKVNDWISMGVSTHLSYSETNAPPNGSGGSNPVRSADVINAATPVYSADGSYNWDNTAVYDFNPIGNSELDIYQYSTKRAIVNPYLNLKLSPSINFRTTAGIDFSGDKGMEHYNPYHGNGAAVNGRTTQSSSDNLSWSISNIATWSKINDNSSVEVIAGQEASGQTYDVLVAGVTDFSVPNHPELVWGSNPETPSSYSTGWNMISYLTQAKYNYGGKYYLSGSLRTDGSSRFGEDNKYGLFYSVGGSWRISEEEFMPEWYWLNNLKLRASYGTSGNSEIGNFASLGLYGAGANYGGYPGLTPVQLANSDIRWEQITNANVGIESRLFDRVDASLEFYTRVSDGLLFNKPLSAGTGFSSVMTNLGSMQNSGIEFTSNVDIIKAGPVKWDMSFNISTNKNEILNLNQDQIMNGAQILEVGGDIYQFYLREWAGVNPDNGMPMWYVNADSKDNASNELPNSSYMDPHGSGRYVTSEYNDAERDYQGSALPDFFGGITNNLSYKNFDLSLYFYYSVGNQVYNYDYANNMHDGTQPGTNLAKDATNAWTPNNRYTDVPRYVVNSTDQSNQLSTRFLEDASYLRLKNLTIGYRLPQNVCERIHLQGMKVFVSGENLWTLTAYKGFDPEQAISGSTNNNIPGSKVFTMGVKIDF